MGRCPVILSSFFWPPLNTTNIGGQVPFRKATLGRPQNPPLFIHQKHDEESLNGGCSPSFSKISVARIIF